MPLEGGAELQSDDVPVNEVARRLFYMSKHCFIFSCICLFVRIKSDQPELSCLNKIELFEA